MNHKIRWGVAGSGGIAKRRTIPEGLTKAAHAELRAVYDVNADINNEIAQEYHVRPASSLHELLSMDIDAVYLATPPQVHMQHVLACADHKKHVLCEKPMALNETDAEWMANACRKAGVILLY
jgi:D-xylose 1-dehydrogenase (NADP+, D-xylono-1,5-lactone-forming)